MNERLTWAQARRLALRSQGIGRARRTEVPDRRASREALRRTVDRTALLQIDSVSVFARAHLMPVFTRTGSWDTSVLGPATAPGRSRLLVEGFAHEAAFVPPEIHALLAFRRRRAAERDWDAVRRASRADPRVIDGVLRTVAELGPVSAAAISRARGDSTRPEEGWGWRRTDTQWIVEYLFRSGRLDGAGRNAQFERLYVLGAGSLCDLTAGSPGDGSADRPGEEAPADRPGEDTAAVTALVRRAARALGIGTPADIADYFRLARGEVLPALDELRASGELADVVVSHPDGDLPMLRWSEAPGTGPIAAGCLVSPFDPVAFHRPRLSALFDVEYRIGIYTPRDRRTHGYYALPFLLGDRFEARVDLRADRSRGVLEVAESHREPLEAMGRRGRRDDAEVAAALAEELQRAALWQGLGDIEVVDRGGLAPAIARAIG